MLSVSADQLHGLWQTNADKRNAALVLLQDGGWPG
jgi:hypothetical protein